jgi:cyanophycin synthetase
VLKERTGSEIHKMKIGAIQTLSGPNIYSYRPVLLMDLDLEDLAERESNEFPGLNDRLLELLPGLREHHCSRRKPGGFVERLKEGTYFGHIVEHVALELTKLAGVPVIHGKTRYAGEPGHYLVAIEYRAEEGTKRLLRLAVEALDSLLKIEPFPLDEELKKIEQIIERTELGPTTRAIVKAAKQRGIPCIRIGDDSLVQLGYGIHRRFIQASMTDRTSAVAVDTASNKELTKSLLRESGIAVPRGLLVESEEEAGVALSKLSPPVAVKPFNGCQGKGVSLNLSSPAEVKTAYRVASQYSPKVVVEEQLSGRDYRVLVIGSKMAAASERVPAQVIGDGEHTISGLIEIANRNPQRGEGHGRTLTKIETDEVMLESLRKRGLSIDDTPRQGETIFLRECANLSTGGTAKDVTNLVHPEVAAVCERAARLIGLDICGIDLILDDIARPIKKGNGIVEVNASPGLRMHIAPSEGRIRDVGGTIIEMLYPDGSSGRIPIISVTGTNGKTTIARMLGHILGESGRCVGMTTTDGIYIGDRRVVEGDTTGPRSARVVLGDPAVEVAVLETARGGIVRSGLGYDWSDISIMSNIRLDHIGQDGIESLDDLLFVKSLVAERVREGGTLILNADDERLAQLMENRRVKRIKKNVVLFSLHPLHVVIRRHLDAGGIAYLYKDGWIVEAGGGAELRIGNAEELPATLKGAALFNVANALAATAACRAYGLSVEQIEAALRSFSGDLHNLGRSVLYQVADKYVVVDYGHNPDAFSTVCRMTNQWEGRQLTAVIGVPGDRYDSVIIEAGRAAAHGFHRFFIKEDKDLRGRPSGEVARLLYEVIKGEAPQRDCRIVLDEIAALRTALNESAPGGIIVVFYEKVDPVLDLLHELGAKPVDEIPREMSTSGRVARA